MKALVLIALVCVAGYIFLGAGCQSIGKHRLAQHEALENI